MRGNHIYLNQNNMFSGFQFLIIFDPYIANNGSKITFNKKWYHHCISYVKKHMTKLVIVFRIWAVSDNLDPILTPRHP